MSEWKDSRGGRLRGRVDFTLSFLNFFIARMFYDYVLLLLLKIICNRITNSVFNVLNSPKYNSWPMELLQPYFLLCSKMMDVLKRSHSCY